MHTPKWLMNNKQIPRQSRPKYTWEKQNYLQKHNMVLTTVQPKGSQVGRRDGLSLLLPLSFLSTPCSSSRCRYFLRKGWIVNVPLVIIAAFFSPLHSSFYILQSKLGHWCWLNLFWTHERVRSLPSKRWPNSCLLNIFVSFIFGQGLADAQKRVASCPPGMLSCLSATTLRNLQLDGL